MVKLCLWLNVKKGFTYISICKYPTYNIGQYNQYGHLLLEIFEYYDNFFTTYLTAYDKVKLKKYRNKTIFSFINKF